MKNFICGLVVLSLLSSCRSLKTEGILYQSVRTRHAQPSTASPIPQEAKIAVAYTISREGELTAIVYNRTSEILVIDQTKSFFVNSDGRSTSYYDPTVRTTSTTDMSSSTKGASVNLGAIAGAFGIGGVLGQVANGVNVGGSGTNGTAVTNATYISDLPQVSIAPYGNGAMSKVFTVDGLTNRGTPLSMNAAPSLTEEQSHCKFSVCITYSFDEGKTFDKIVTNFYANSNLFVPVSSGRQVNNALRQLYSAKSDAVNERLWILNFATTSSKEENLGNSFGVLYDYN